MFISHMDVSGYGTVWSKLEWEGYLVEIYRVLFCVCVRERERERESDEMNIVVERTRFSCEEGNIEFFLLLSVRGFLTLFATKYQIF